MNNKRKQIYNYIFYHLVAEKIEIADALCIPVRDVWVNLIQLAKVGLINISHLNGKTYANISE